MSTKKKIGIICLEYTYGPIPGDIDYSESFGESYEPCYEKVSHLSFEACQEAEQPTEANGLVKSLEDAVKKLVLHDKVVAVSGDCGFMMYLQEYIERLIRKITHQPPPVFMSSLFQIPMIQAILPANAKIAVFTANSASLEKDEKELFKQYKFHIKNNPLIDLVGLQHAGGFQYVAMPPQSKSNKPLSDRIKEPQGDRTIETASATDIRKARASIMEAAEKAKAAGVQAIVFECTELPHYAHSVRKATHLPVFDVVTMIDYFANAVNTSENAW